MTKHNQTKQKTEKTLKYEKILLHSLTLFVHGYYDVKHVRIATLRCNHLMRRDLVCILGMIDGPF